MRKIETNKQVYPVLYIKSQANNKFPLDIRLGPMAKNTVIQARKLVRRILAKDPDFFKSFLGNRYEINTYAPHPQSKEKKRSWIMMAEWGTVYNLIVKYEFLCREKCNL